MNKELKVNLFFPSLVYFMEKPEWIETINKISNEYIEKANVEMLVYYKKEKIGMET
jgi:hypothetical protein